MEEAKKEGPWVCGGCSGGNVSITHERAAALLNALTNAQCAGSEELQEAVRLGASALSEVAQLRRERDDLVNALEREQHKTWGKMWSKIDGEPNEALCDALSLDLLVKHGRLTKDGNIYRWKTP